VRVVILTLPLLLSASPLYAQSGARLQGRVLDAAGSVLPGALVVAVNPATGFATSDVTDAEGRYHLEAVPAGTFRVTVSAAGFRSQVVEQLRVEVARTIVRDFRLEVGETRELVTVRAERPLIDRATAAMSHVVTAESVREIPLNGGHFVDLGLLVPGSVAPSQTGFSSRPIRGVGALAFNTAGNREESVAFLVNGVTTNNLTFGSLGFRPPIASIQEFKVDSSTFSAQYGHTSGAVVNLVTRSGTNRLQGLAYEFFRDDALDARNFFEADSSEPTPFTRHQFGGYLGGPIARNRAFFAAAYDGTRQRQEFDLNSLVPSDAQRASATDPGVHKLLELIPRANVVDPDGTPRFVGRAAAPIDVNTWTADVQLNLTHDLHVHGFYGGSRRASHEPGGAGTSIPGFGHVLDANLSLLTMAATLVAGSGFVNEARFGRSALAGAGRPAAAHNPADFGIRNGVDRPIGLPQMLVAGGLSFGGPAVFPSGRDDALYVASDTLTLVKGRHALSVGGEYRHFLNENFAEGTGSFNFSSVESFLAGTANGFSITLGERRSHIRQRAIGVFIQDRFTVRPSVTLDLGLRYEWHVTPTERQNRFVVFDAARVALLRVGEHLDDVYRQNNGNVEPRLGVAWDVHGDGRMVVRAAYGLAVDQPSTTAVTNTVANPPLAIPLAASGSIPVAAAIERTSAAGLAPATIDQGFRNASMRSWNVNLQRQIARNFAVTAAYVGSSGRDLRIGRNLNQPVDGMRPFATLSLSSPILPGEPLGNIIQIESTGFSTYHALWVSSTKRLSNGSAFDVSYTWSKSLDTNSLNSSDFAVQDSHDLGGQFGLSDFDARHRFVLSGVYALPFGGHPLTRGWQVAAIVQSQSGNPVNIVTADSTLNGTPNTVRPDLVAPIRILGTVEQWFDPSAFAAVNRFGTLGRNVVIGPAFHNTDVSIARTLRLGDRARLQIRADVFDLFNHANLGPPGNIVGSPTFGRITRTRLPTGEAGSSRQCQLAVKVSF
jgi:hypothetical protein